MATNWETLAAQKREEIKGAIPKEWIIPSIPTVEEVKDITGSYIQQFLTPKEIEITETDAVDIVKNTTTGVWSAVEVTKAFCHRAALAHQLVCGFFIPRSIFFLIYVLPCSNISDLMSSSVLLYRYSRFPTFHFYVLFYVSGVPRFHFKEPSV
jgi:hypothetical protein